MPKNASSCGEISTRPTGQLRPAGGRWAGPAGLPVGLRLTSRGDWAMAHTEPAHTTAFWNPFANMATLAGEAITIVRGEGCTVYDADGRAYLDALASLWYCNVGYGRAELAEATAPQMREIAGVQTFTYCTR